MENIDRKKKVASVNTGGQKSKNRNKLKDISDDRINLDNRDLTYKLNSEWTGIYHFKLQRPLDIKAPAKDLENGILKSICTYYSTIFSHTILKNGKKIEGKTFSEIFETEEVKNFIKDFTKNDFKTSGFTKLKINKQRKDFFNSWEGVVQNNKLTEVFGTLIEISKEKQKTLKNIENQEGLFKNLFQSNPEAVVYLDKHSKVIDINPRFTELFGYSIEEIKGKDINNVVVPEDLVNEGKNFDRVALKKGYSNTETIRKKKDGTTFPVLVTGSPIIINGEKIGMIGMYLNISQQKKIEEEMKSLATHDMLTGLPNRTLLIDRFTTAKGRALRANKKIALLLIDLYQFKDINDTFGHDIGDQILQKTAQRLSDQFRQYDTVTRFGGDEFVVLIEDISVLENILSIVNKIISSFDRPIILEDKEFDVKVSTGIAILPNDSNDLPDLLRKADIAMYNAKTKGPNTYEFYTRGIEVKRKTIQDELKRREIEFKTIFEKAPIGIMLINKRSEILRVNPTILKMLGYEKNELLLKNFTNFAANEEKERLSEIIEKFEQGEISSFTDDVKSVAKNGNLVLSKISFSPVKDIDGNINYYIAMVDDVTEIRKAQIELKENEEMLEKIIEGSPVPIFVINDEHKITHWNNAMEALTGFKKKEMLGTGYQWLAFYDDKRPVLADLIIDGANEEKIFEIYGGKIKKSPLIADAYEGMDFFSTEKVKEKWLEFTAVSIKDSQGKVISALETIIDVTNRVRNEKTLSSLYQILEAVFETKDLIELYKSIHKTVQGLMYAENFYIALYDEEKDFISFPYFVDQYDKPPEARKTRKGATEYLLKTRKSLLATEETFEKLEKNEKIEKIGENPISWLGVPLELEDKVIGALVIQSYTTNVYYGQEEKNILEFISKEIALAIERKKSEEKLQELLDLERIAHKESKTLASVISVLFSKVNLSEVFREILTQVKLITPYTSANIALIKGNVVYNICTQGYEKYNAKDFVEQSMQAIDEYKIPWKTILEKKPLLIKNTAEEPLWKVHKETQWIKSHIAMPIFLKDELIGLLRLDSDEPSHFTEQDIKKLEPFANAAAIAINNARLFEEAKSRAEQKKINNND
jgi:diguanylate cyclase (GGDEF)-like protein/PAS domain S-box-containing protein